MISQQSHGKFLLCELPVRHSAAHPLSVMVSVERSCSPFLFRAARAALLFFHEGVWLILYSDLFSQQEIIF